MDIGQLCSILAACISTNPEQRKAGETTLEQVLYFNAEKKYHCSTGNSKKGLHQRAPNAMLGRL